MDYDATDATVERAAESVRLICCKRKGADLARMMDDVFPSLGKICTPLVLFPIGNMIDGRITLLHWCCIDSGLRKIDQDLSGEQQDPMASKHVKFAASTATNASYLMHIDCLHDELVLGLFIFVHLHRDHAPELSQVTLQSGDSP